MILGYKRGIDITEVSVYKVCSHGWGGHIQYDAHKLPDRRQNPRIFTLNIGGGAHNT
jgi:hypothetical protein